MEVGGCPPRNKQFFLTFPFLTILTKFAAKPPVTVNLYTWASLLLLSCSLLRCLSRSILACSAGLGIGATGLVVGGVTVCGGAGAGLGCRGATGAAGAALRTGAGLLNNSSSVRTNRVTK